jgi:hypothetical protein
MTSKNYSRFRLDLAFGWAGLASLGRFSTLLCRYVRYQFSYLSSSTRLFRHFPRQAGRVFATLSKHTNLNPC